MKIHWPPMKYLERCKTCKMEIFSQKTPSLMSKPWNKCRTSENFWHKNNDVWYGVLLCLTVMAGAFLLYFMKIIVSFFFKIVFWFKTFSFEDMMHCINCSVLCFLTSFTTCLLRFIALVILHGVLLKQFYMML